MLFWKIAALGLAGTLDLAMGTLIAHVLAQISSYPLEWWQYAIGACLGASPDIDLLLGSFGVDRRYHHEHLTHRPIVGLPLAFFLGWLFGGMFWGVVAVTCVFWHYLHDTHGFLCLYDNGLGWFWPFSRKYWGVRNYRVVSESLEEFLDKTRNDAVFFGGYLSPSGRSVTEFFLAGIILSCVAEDLLGSPFGVFVLISFWGLITLMWTVSPGPPRTG